jgi:hypothetical protein
MNLLCFGRRRKGKRGKEKGKGRIRDSVPFRHERNARVVIAEYY